MGKKENLIPFEKGSKRAKELGKKGGKKSTERKAFTNFLNPRKNCNPTCKIFYKCPFMPISAKKFKGRCALKEMPMKVQERTIDILRNESEGMIDTLRTMILDMAMISDTTDSLKAKAIVFDKIKDLHEMIYGKKVKQEMKTEGEIVVKFMDNIGKKRDKK